MLMDYAQFLRYSCRNIFRAMPYKGMGRTQRRCLTLPLELDERIRKLAPDGEISRFCRMAIAAVVNQIENQLREPKPNE